MKDRRVAKQLIREDTRAGINSPFNIECSIVLYKHRKGYFIQFFGVDRKLYETNVKLTDFHYQNQVDRDESISDEDWEEREKVWDEIFEESNAPSAAGLAIEINSDASLWYFFTLLDDRIDEEEKKKK